MKLPKKIKIANHVYKIVAWSDEIAFAKSRFGECDCLALEIRIQTNNIKSLVSETLVHEIMHAIYWSYNIKVEDDEERIVGTMAVGMSQVLQDNKMLRNFLLSK